jgi:hypothetical protein
MKGNILIIVVCGRVTRSAGWVGQSRRPSKDDERLCATGEMLIYTTMTRLMLRRLAHA